MKHRIPALIFSDFVNTRTSIFLESVYRRLVKNLYFFSYILSRALKCNDSSSVMPSAKPSHSLHADIECFQDLLLSFCYDQFLVIVISNIVTPIGKTKSFG